MGDNDPAVTETVSGEKHAPTGFASTDYNEVNSSAGPDGSALDSGAVGDSSFVALADGADNIQDNSTSVDGTSIHKLDTYTAMQPVTSTSNDTPTVAVFNTTGNLVSQEHAVAESTQAGPSDSSVNGNGDETKTFASTGHEVNGNASNDANQAVAEQQYDEVPVLSTEEERLWSAVKTNSLDFNSWIALIEETEKVAEDKVLKIRKVYDAFLAEFPLCYGYWKKYAEHEARLSSTERVIEVFERGVEAVTYSVDMWLHYCVFAMSTYGDPDKVRRLFERGLAYVGTDYLSFFLWDKYIEYEYQLQQWGHLAMIYTRILENPNQQLDRYFSSFKELGDSRPLSELRNTEEAATVTATNSDATNQGVDGEVNPDHGQNSNLAGAGFTKAEELEKYIAIREEMFKKTKEYDAKIIAFETAIRRPYFHVRPLNGSELENWHNYLDFIEKDDDFNKVIKLYERCLIACANYPEYWIRYVLCMEISESMDMANNALARATQVFVKRQPEIHLFAARFNEQNGDILGARAAYQLLHSEICPGLLEAVNKHANMEHRLGNMEAAFSLYDQAIVTEIGKEQSQTLPLLFAQYARFQYLVAGNVEKAREILDGSLEHIQLSRPFLETLIHLESVLPAPKRIDYIDSLVEKFIMPSSDNTDLPSTSDREDLSSIYLEFLDLFGDIQMVKKASDRHAKLFLSYKSTSELKKRGAEDFMVSDKTKLSKSSVEVPSSTQPVVGAYPNTQNQWATSYAAQPQAWTQVPQVQGQQYPGYAQQAGYGGYNSSYAQPQVLASTPQIASSPQNAPVPQVAAYGSYPPSYPTQSFAQQNHVPVQPTTAPYAPAPVQQPAPISQAYNGTYY